MSVPSALSKHRALAKRLARRAGVVRFLIGALLLSYTVAVLAVLPLQFQSLREVQTRYDAVLNSHLSGGARVHDVMAANQQRRVVEAQTPLVGTMFAVRALQLIGIILLARAYRRRLSQSALEKKFTRVELSRLQVLRDTLSRCAEVLGVDLERLVVWSNRSQHVAPSIVEVKGVPQLLIPMGFLALLARDRVSADAMLAHELGHVVQRDSRLWIQTWLVSRLLLRVLIPLDVLLIIVRLFAMAADPAAADLILVDVVASLVLLSIVLSIVRFALASRSKSELAADVAAAGCYGPECVAMAIERYVPTQRSHGWGGNLRVRRLSALEELAGSRGT